MNFIIFLLAYNLLYILCEVLYKYFGKQELIRKIAHIGTGLITFFSLKYLNIYNYIFLCILFIIIFILIKKFNLLKFLKQKGRGNGDIFFILGQAISLSFINSNILITKIGLLILTLADGISPLGNKIIKKKLYLYKTIGSFLLFFIISIFILYSFYGLSYKIFIIGLIVSIGELLSTKGFDNITIPILIASSIILIG